MSINLDWKDIQVITAVAIYGPLRGQEIGKKVRMWSGTYCSILLRLERLGLLKAEKQPDKLVLYYATTDARRMVRQLIAEGVDGR